MLTQRKEGAEKLEGMAKSKGLKFTGLKNMKTSSKIALVILVAVVLISILAPIIAPYDPYAIGMARPVSVMVDTVGTECVPVADIERAIGEVFDLRPGAIIDDLDLRRPIYRKTAAYGHFGRELPEFTWEKTDRADALRAACGLA